MSETIISIISFIWTSVLKLWTFRQRPRLQVYFAANESYHTRPIEDGGSAFFCHVMVQNTGKALARNCRGRLIRVEMRESGRFVPHPDFKNPVVLKWSHEPDFEPRDVEADLPRRLDVCYARESSAEVLRFFCKKQPSGNRTDFSRGIYLVTIRCDGESLSQVDAQFVIKHQSAWNEISVESFGELFQLKGMCGR